MKVSFIIPVFKVEKYIHNCINSIISQTYHDIEIILVDDGSPDKCPQICDEIAFTDSRIKVLHKANGGLSDARNAGLLMASGEYVVFVDGDDFWMHKNDLERLVEICNKKPQADFIGFNCCYYYPLTQTFTPWPRYEKNLESTQNKNTAIVNLTRTSSFVMSACMKIIKREFLIDNGLFFIKGQMAEDIPWFINMLDKCNGCAFINMNIYAYRQGDPGSITHNIGLRNVDCLINIIETELGMIKKRSFNKEAQDCILSFLAYEYSIVLGYLQFVDKTVAKDRYDYLRKYQYLLKYTQDPKVKKVNLVYRLLGLRLTTRLLQIKVKSVIK